MTNDFDLLDTLPVAVLLINPQDRIEYASPTAVALVGGSLIGASFTSLFRNPGCLNALAEARVSGKAKTVSISRFLGNNETSLLFDFRPYGGEGKIAVLLQDETASRQINQRQRDFVANVSHELRTPLTAIMGYLETLLGPARSDQDVRERFLSTMLAEAARMKRLIEDLLMLSRVQSQERQRPEEKVDLAEIVGKSAALQRGLAKEHGVEVEISLPASPVILRGDSDQLSQVFNNLLENAVKYGAHPGVIRVDFGAHEKDAILGVPAVSVSVRDDGQGVESHHLARLTERFYRVDTHRSREMGGTGLGLAIVKHILNRHRGRLEIDSVPGRGSCFTTIFPAEKAG